MGALNTRYITQGSTPNSGEMMWAMVQTSAADQTINVKMLKGVDRMRTERPYRLCSIWGCEMALILRTQGVRITIPNRRRNHGTTMAQIPPTPNMYCLL